MSQIPLFPLNTVHFPGGLLPLRIFETRYLDMVTHCIKHQEEFGVVSVFDDSHSPHSNPYHFQRVGTSSKIIDIDIQHTNLMMIRCLGQKRFHIQSASQRDDGLWIGEIEWIAPDQNIQLPDDLSDSADFLHKLIHSFGKQGIKEDELPIQTPYLFDDCGWIANRWCELLDMSLQQKQRLLELDSPLVRLELVQDILLENLKQN